MTLNLQPITFDEACDYIVQHHRHHIAPQGWKFGIAANDGVQIVGVAVMGRPVNRTMDDGWTIEIIRLCTDGTKNAPTFLMGAAWRATKALGFRRLITYTLATEPGVSLRAAGFTLSAEVKATTWNNNVRQRIDKHPVVDKLRWEMHVPGDHPSEPRLRVIPRPTGQQSLWEVTG